MGYIVNSTLSLSSLSLMWISIIYDMCVFLGFLLDFHLFKLLKLHPPLSNFINLKFYQYLWTVFHALCSACLGLSCWKLTVSLNSILRSLLLLQFPLFFFFFFGPSLNCLRTNILFSTFYISLYVFLSPSPDYFPLCSQG